MTKTNQRNAAVTDEPTTQFSSDIATLKGSFAQLRDDVTKLLDSTLETGKSGAEMVKDRGAESVERFGQKISERPLLSAAIAMGIGYVLAKLFMTKR